MRTRAMKSYISRTFINLSKQPSKKYFKKYRCFYNEICKTGLPPFKKKIESENSDKSL
jgi:hypothetical protein